MMGLGFFLALVLYIGLALLDGGPGRDRLDGGAGDDTLLGGERDILHEVAGVTNIATRSTPWRHRPPSLARRGELSLGRRRNEQPLGTKVHIRLSKHLIASCHR